MKSTDIARRDRDLKKAAKKEDVLKRKQDKPDKTPGDFINELSELFFHDAEQIYNIEMSEEILELLMEIQENAPEKQWDNILRKAVKKTGVKKKDEAYKQLCQVGEFPN